MNQKGVEGTTGLPGPRTAELSSFFKVLGVVACLRSVGFGGGSEESLGFRDYMGSEEGFLKFRVLGLLRLLERLTCLRGFGGLTSQGLGGP